LISLPFVAPKALAEKAVRGFLAGRGLTAEVGLNGGMGLRFDCHFQSRIYRLTVYSRKTGLSSCVVCDNVPEAVVGELKEALASLSSKASAAAEEASEASSTASAKAVLEASCAAAFKPASEDASKAAPKPAKASSPVRDLLADLRRPAAAQASAAWPAPLSAPGALSAPPAKAQEGLPAREGAAGAEASLASLGPAAPEASLPRMEAEGGPGQEAMEAPEESEALREAVRRFTKDVYDFLFPIDKRTLVSGLAVLDMVRRTGLKLPRYNALFYPFSTVLEGFLAKLLVEKGIIDLESYKHKPYNDQLGPAIRGKSLRPFIADPERHEVILDRLVSAWIHIRCQELHSDPLRSERIFELESLSELENKLGELASVMVDSWRIFIDGSGPPPGTKPGGGPSSKPAPKAPGQPPSKPAPKAAAKTAAKTSAKTASEAKTSAKTAAKTVAKTVAKAASEAKTAPKAASKPASKPGPPKPLECPKIRLGTDESGKGDYFGPLVVAGVYCDEAIEKALLEIGVRDSKSSTDSVNRAQAQRVRSILGEARYEIRMLPPARYNSLWESRRNLNVILAMAHAGVIDGLLAKVDCGFVIVDQFADESLLSGALADLGRKVTLFQTTKGERDPAVAAASVLARAAFIDELAKAGKALGVELPKGAGEPVDRMGRRLLREMGAETLRELAKVHFKNSKKIGL
jgi:ribonuclease HIII